MIEKADESRLTSSELKEYERYIEQYGSIRTPILVKTFVVLLWVAWLYATIESFGWVTEMNAMERYLETVRLAIGIVQGAFMFFGPVALLGISILAGQKASEKRKQVEVEAARYLRNTYRDPLRRSHQGDSCKSLRRMQHEWYGDHMELDWRHRVRAEMYGLDVDTYLSNVLED